MHICLVFTWWNTPFPLFIDDKYFIIMVGCISKIYQFISAMTSFVTTAAVLLKFRTVHNLRPDVIK